MIFCIIYFLATFVVPAKATYHLLKDELSFTGSDHLWAVYWAIYVFVSLLQCYMPFLQIKTFEIIAMVFLVWLYQGQFKGALYIKEFLLELFEDVQIIKAIVDMLKSMNLMLRIFEDEQKIKSE